MNEAPPVKLPTASVSLGRPREMRVKFELVNKGPDPHVPLDAAAKPEPTRPSA